MTEQISRDEEVRRALETIFAADSEIYQSRGFQRRIGLGTRPALLIIDLANAWTRPGAASASAPNTLGAMYQPVRVRMFTASGRSQFMTLPSGAVTLIGW